MYMLDQNQANVVELLRIPGFRLTVWIKEIIIELALTVLAQWLECWPAGLWV